MASVEELRGRLGRLDGRGYRAYRELTGSWQFPEFTLAIDHVQGDPFAAPSRLRVRLDASIAAFPPALYRTRVRRIALEDFVCRGFDRALRGRRSAPSGSGKSGSVGIDVGGQEVLERTAVVVDARWVEARLEVGLPAAGRRILGRACEKILCDELPRLVERCLRWANLPQAEAQRFVECVENQEAIRGRLSERGLVAFVADGSILPRESGVSDLPLARAVPFRSPASLRISFELPNPLADPMSDGKAGGTTLSGMGIPEGVTLIVGGGYHGKSTLLRALARSVYPHVPGDGREGVVTERNAVVIRAEDGRRIERVDVGAFIGDLPGARSTRALSTDDASGSTSQAANIVEAVEAGASTLLLDEDTCATNFMVRDARMQELIPARREPITPLIDRVLAMHQRWGTSTILVMGGCGDYFDVADHVIAMHEFLPEDATDEARAVASRIPTRRRVERSSPLAPIRGRSPAAKSFDASRGRREEVIRVRARDELQFGTSRIDLRGVEQLVDPSQTRAVGFAILRCARSFVDDRATLRQIVDALDELLDREGLDVLDPLRFESRGSERHPGNFARPRSHEIAAAVNRLRTLRIREPAAD